jgi:hypothetical protein
MTPSRFSSPPKRTTPRRPLTPTEKTLLWIGGIIFVGYGIVASNTTPTHNDCSNLNGNDRLACEQLHHVIDGGK